MRSLELRESELEQQLPAKEETVTHARSEARALETELAELRQRLNERRNALNSGEGRIAFNEERKQELESRIGQNREDIAVTNDKLAQQEFAFIAANEALEALARRIAGQEIQLASQRTHADAKANANGSIRRCVKAGPKPTRTQTIIASMQAKIESSMAQLESNREPARQLADEEERLVAETGDFRMEMSRFASEVDTAAARIIELEEVFQAAGVRFNTDAAISMRRVPLPPKHTKPSSNARPAWMIMAVGEQRRRI